MRDSEHRPQEGAIEAFWAWWPTVAQVIARSFRDKGLGQELIHAIAEHVAAIDDRLDWEFGPGVKSEHHFCLSGKGDPALRVVAERWLRGAPKGDPTWEFYASRQGNPRGGMKLEINGFALELDQVAFVLEEDEGRERLHVKVFHPLFSKINDEQLAMRIAFIALDNTLGEDDVERWIGAIELGEGVAVAPVMLSALRERVRAFASKATGERWTLLEGSIDGAPIFVLVNTAIKRVDHLLLDMHVEVVIPLAEPTEEGLTISKEADVLNAMQDELDALLGDEAIHVARETTRGKRILHYHVMEGGPAAALFERWRSRYDGRDGHAYAIEVLFSNDPQWDVLRRWM
ncbi:MAG: DUF695 domain-containing protein [Myxococcales bacterium]|nr:DUF695 domain-containing protein [Myxococcales bacterium]